MSAAAIADQRADRIAARVTGLGVGLIAFMLTWIISARITERVLDPPNSAYLAMAMAIAVCVGVTLRVGHRLIASVGSLPDDGDSSGAKTLRSTQART